MPYPPFRSNNLWLSQDDGALGLPNVKAFTDTGQNVDTVQCSTGAVSSTGVWRTWLPNGGTDTGNKDARVWQGQGWCVRPADMVPTDLRGRAFMAPQTRFGVVCRLNATNSNTLAVGTNGAHLVASLWKVNLNDPTQRTLFDAAFSDNQYSIAGPALNGSFGGNEVIMYHRIDGDHPDGVWFERHEVLLYQVGIQVTSLATAVGGNSVTFRLSQLRGSRLQLGDFEYSPGAVNGHGLRVWFDEDPGDAVVEPRGGEMSKIIKIVRPIQPTIVAATADRTLAGYREAATATDQTAALEHEVRAIRRLAAATGNDAAMNRQVEATRPITSSTVAAGAVARWVDAFRRRDATSELAASVDRMIEGYRQGAATTELAGHHVRRVDVFRARQTSIRVTTGEISKIIKRTYTGSIRVASELAKVVLRDQAAATALSASAIVLLTKVMATASRLTGTVKRAFVSVRRLETVTRAVGSARIEAPVSVWERSVGDGTTVVKRTTYIFDD